MSASRGGVWDDYRVGRGAPFGSILAPAGADARALFPRFHRLDPHRAERRATGGAQQQRWGRNRAGAPKNPTATSAEPGEPITPDRAYEWAGQRASVDSTERSDAPRARITALGDLLGAGDRVVRSRCLLQSRLSPAGLDLVLVHDTLWGRFRDRVRVNHGRASRPPQSERPMLEARNSSDTRRIY